MAANQAGAGDSVSSRVATIAQIGSHQRIWQITAPAGTVWPT